MHLILGCQADTSSKQNWNVLETNKLKRSVFSFDSFCWIFKWQITLIHFQKNIFFAILPLTMHPDLYVIIKISCLFVNRWMYYAKYSTHTHVLCWLILVWVCWCRYKCWPSESKFYCDQHALIFIRKTD